MESSDVCLVARQMVCKGLRYWFFFSSFCFILLLLILLSVKFSLWCILVFSVGGLWKVLVSDYFGDKSYAEDLYFRFCYSLLCFHAIFMIKYFYSPGCFH